MGVKCNMHGREEKCIHGPEEKSAWENWAKLGHDIEREGYVLQGIFRLH